MIGTAYAKKVLAGVLSSALAVTVGVPIWMLPLLPMIAVTLRSSGVERSNQQDEPVEAVVPPAFTTLLSDAPSKWLSSPSPLKPALSPAPVPYQICFSRVKKP